MIRIFLISVVSFMLAAASYAITLTQNVSMIVQQGNSVSCNSGGLHNDNGYFRAFNLADYNWNEPLVLNSVTFGIQFAKSGGDHGQPMQVRIYDGYSVTSFLNPGTLVGSFDTEVRDGSLFLQNVPVSGTITSGKLVVELFTPNGQAEGNRLMIGSNSLGQSAPSYIQAPVCGISSPTNLASLGFPGMHVVMSVHASAVPEPGSLLVLALGAVPLLRKKFRLKRSQLPDC